MNARNDARVKLRSLLLTALDAGSVDRQQLAAVEAEPPAQQHKLAEHRFEGAAIVASEVRDRLEVRLEATQQPDDLDIALGFPLQPSARSDPVEVAIDVELQQITGRKLETRTSVTPIDAEPSIGLDGAPAATLWSNRSLGWLDSSSREIVRGIFNV
jgi:hypothetical protein